MAVQNLICCAICGAYYLEGSSTGCPKCSGRESGVVRALTSEPAAKPHSKEEPPVHSHKAEQGFVCGWLVRTRGKEKGQYESLLEGIKNGVRESERFDTPSVEDAHILYDHVENLFWIINGRGRNLVRVNGALLLNATALSKGDRIQVGEDEFTFIPLCAANFKW